MRSLCGHRCIGRAPVSYTHLDVYKRQALEIHGGLSRSTRHRMVARGKLETIKRVVRRRLVPAEQVERLCGIADADHSPEAA